MIHCYKDLRICKQNDWQYQLHQICYLLYRDMLGEGVQVNDFEKGVKWFRLMVDVPASAALVAKGKMSLIKRDENEDGL